ncbi:signal recognition particle-docking protein FtsY [Gimesia maris]|jgi:fused signal recognition particle receptor|uniref:Signal recognition particle receptor FtsY n=1 Tax=Gimesia maris TaxID=122 RepID=A0A3D3RFE7_9PLAN|nr:signal recognition particle-docking protein FtsY [Gimesia maris]MAC52438.1 signal recognition particle-docking protein FtsY [Gimesia sp.]QDT79931.1 Signal recognition particle receptor FtsY [Gimesia maris]HCO27553.1 signal recognition particle-docking protein FtsY [Gimesia maris]|tara:strand:- start:61222 stop:62169 length:948 start_codon:yes stop_codon:yes gene_type:complete
MGLFDRLKRGLEKTKEVLRTDVRDLFKAGEILDDQKIEQFEARLIKTDMGVVASSAICEEIRKKHGGRTVILDEIEETVKEKIRTLLEGEGDTKWDISAPLSPLNKNPDGVTVILVAGVNGVGKTTSIAKLANLILKQNKSVLLAAGDTFRAAAVEQLTMWADRLGCEIVTRPDGTDPASVAYSGCERALETGVDYLIIDTAGRLQTHTNLMEELEKIKRVVSKKIPNAPHESLLVLDATTGQNGISQAEHFSKSIECSGLILAKLDGTARGGVTVAIRQKMGIPVKYVGVGEQIDDLELFNSQGFVDALFSSAS